MARTANVFARVEPGVKEQAEKVLDELGIQKALKKEIANRQTHQNDTFLSRNP